MFEFFCQSGRSFFSATLTIRRYLHTIYALSSGRGVSGVAVIRISGPSAQLALTSLAGFGSVWPPNPRHAYLRRIVHPATGRLIDRGLILWFPKPDSFTGEDVVELHVHGGPAVVKSLFNALSNLKEYRMAEPGEFMRRSFNNGKVDLAGAEAIADLIAAETEAQHALAIDQIDRTNERIELYASWRRKILQALATVEAWIDFSEQDDIEDGVMAKARLEMTALKDEIRARMSDARRGQRLREGIHVAIVGPPNAGKSSLMNALCRDDDVSIVSPIAGTTRDAIERPCDIAGYPIVLVDTAGLRDSTSDPIEQVGVARSRARAHAADVLVFVLDASDLNRKEIENLNDPQTLDAKIGKILTAESAPNLKLEIASSQTPVVVVLNKIDLLPEELRRNLPNGNVFCLPDSRRQAVVCSISCTTRLNFETFLHGVARMAEQLCGDGVNAQKEPPLVSGLRQSHHLNGAANYLQSFIDGLSPSNHQAEGDAVVAAEYLRLAVRELGKLTGEITTEDVLDQIFRSFCIGK